jgi:uncharacterized protein (DUF169 family)
MGNAEPCANLRLCSWAGSSMPKLADIPLVFSDAVAQTYLTGKPIFCSVAKAQRKFSRIADEEIVMGFPGEMVLEMVDAV